MTIRLTGSSCYLFCSEIEPNSLSDCINVLRKNGKLPTPTTDQEWLDVPHIRIDVRKEHVLADSIHEMRKPHFDHTQLLTVCDYGWMVCIYDFLAIFQGLLCWGRSCRYWGTKQRILENYHA